MKRIVRISLALLLALAACDRASSPGFGDEPEDRVCTVAYLKSLCRGDQTRIAQELYLHAVVTANDLHGEFVRTLVVEDAGGGISIAVDALSLADSFPLGAAITVACNGLTLGVYGGKVQLGMAPTGSYGVDRIPADELSRYLRVTAPNAHARQPAVLSFGKVDRSHVDTYVRFERVRFAEAPQAWCDSDPETGHPVTTRRTLTDASGATFVVRTPGTALYATEPLPQGEGSVNGIVDYFNGEFSLRVVNREIDFR